MLLLVWNLLVLLHSVLLSWITVPLAAALPLSALPPALEDDCGAALPSGFQVGAVRSSPTGEQRTEHSEDRVFISSSLPAGSPWALCGLLLQVTAPF